MVPRAFYHAHSHISAQSGHSSETLPCTAAGHNVVVKHPLPLLHYSEEGSLKNSAEQLSIKMWLTAPGEDNSRTCWEYNVLQTQVVRTLP